ncbi:MAG: type II toxin-antitoxin system VapB family antitoxin [Planctomycetota bacterium]|jgi:Arc/MetJ family transcription regulator
MRISVILDDGLVENALRISKLGTKKELIATALQEFVMNHSRKDLRDLKGKISFRKDYDYKSLR